MAIKATDIIREADDISFIEVPTFEPIPEEFKYNDAPMEPWRGLSDIDGMSIEWEYDSGYRHWETFDSDEEMKKVLDENDEIWKKYRTACEEYEKNKKNVIEQYIV